MPTMNTYLCLLPIAFFALIAQPQVRADTKTQKQIAWLEKMESLSTTTDDDKEMFLEEVEPDGKIQFFSKLDSSLLQSKLIMTRFKTIAWKMMDYALNLEDRNYSEVQKVVLVAAIILSHTKQYFVGSDFTKVANLYEQGKNGFQLKNVFVQPINANKGQKKPILNALALPYQIGDVDHFDNWIKSAKQAEEPEQLDDLVETMQALLKFSSLETIAGKVLGDSKRLSILVRCYFDLALRYPARVPLRALPVNFLNPESIQKLYEIYIDATQTDAVRNDIQALVINAMTDGIPTIREVFRKKFGTELIDRVLSNATKIEKGRKPTVRRTRASDSCNGTFK